jgi:hypothetical protein
VKREPEIERALALDGVPEAMPQSESAAKAAAARWAEDAPPRDEGTQARPHAKLERLRAINRAPEPVREAPEDDRQDCTCKPDGERLKFGTAAHWRARLAREADPERAEELPEDRARRPARRFPEAPFAALATLPTPDGAPLVVAVVVEGLRELRATVESMNVRYRLADVRLPDGARRELAIERLRLPAEPDAEPDAEPLEDDLEVGS